MSFNDVLIFLREYWRELLSALLLILSFILCLVRKKPLKVVDSLKGQYMTIILQAIRAAEKTDLKGHDKLNYACNFVWNAIKDKYPEGVSLDDFKDTLIHSIELILETPQKK